MFKMIDTDNSGQITFDELKAGLKRVGANLKESEIYDLMQAVSISPPFSHNIKYLLFASNMNEMDGSLKFVLGKFPQQIIRMYSLTCVYSTRFPVFGLISS